MGSNDKKVYAFNPDGSLKWDYQTGGIIFSTPAIGADGTVYVGSFDTRIYALNPNGIIKWSYQTGDEVWSSPAIGADGTIYVGSDDSNIYALTPNGSLKWIYTTGDRIQSSPALGADDTIYVGSDDNNVYALTPNGSLKWIYTTGDRVQSSPAVGADGTVYVGSNDSNIYALTPNGSLKWNYSTWAPFISSPAIGADGTVYVGSLDNNVYDFTPDGGLMWSYSAGGGVFSSPAIGADGTVYVGSTNGKVYALYPDSTPKWSYQTWRPVHSSPALGADGTLYIGSWDGNLYAFGSSVIENLTRPCSTACGTGIETYQNGTWVGCTAPQPQPEICDGRDNDCDGQVDEGGVCSIVIYYRDADGDGYGNPANKIKASSAPSGYVTDSTDCDDANKSVHPGAPEIPCNGNDEDCSGGDDCSSPGGGVCQEDDSRALDVGGAQGAAGSEVLVPVRIQSAPGDVSAISFKIAYDANILEYKGFERGYLVRSFNILDVNPVSSAASGVLKVGGFSYESPISRGSSGDLIWLKFMVKNGQENSCYPLRLEGLKDDTSNFSASGGCFCIHPVCYGDINGDGTLSPADALIVFKCYLGSGPCPPCIDVNNDGEVTPLDALCIFQKYLGKPSCLD